MATVQLIKAAARSRAGKGAARAERRAGRVPGIIYGDGKDPLPISLDYDELRQRIRDFVTVLGCRFPTVQDARATALTRSTSRALAAWRYRFRKYDQPWELDLWKRVVKPRDPKVASI